MTSRPTLPTVAPALRRAALLVVLLTAAWPAAAQTPPPYAQGPSPERTIWRFARWTAEDAFSLPGQLASRDVLYVAGAAGALFLAAQVDEPLAGFTEPLPDGGLTHYAELVGDRDVVPPALLGVFGTTLLIGDERMQDAAFTSMEAFLFAGLMTNALKGVFGRARPEHGEGAAHFDPFSGLTSFPSGHATTAFAVLTPWALYYPGLATPLLLGVSASSAFSRLATNRHWFTDVVAGSAIGFTIGYWLTQRHLRDVAPVDAVPLFGPEGPGLALRVDF